MNSDSFPWYVKAGAGILSIACVMILTLTNRIDGAQALDAVKVIGGVFIASSGALGAGQAIARSLTARGAANAAALASLPGKIASAAAAQKEGN